jgi:hypothetical protein
MGLIQVKSGLGKPASWSKTTRTHLVWYIRPGVGMAKIHWDRPANDMSDSNSDPPGADYLTSGEQPTPTPSTKGTPSPSPVLAANRHKDAVMSGSASARG